MHCERSEHTQNVLKEITIISYSNNSKVVELLAWKLKYINYKKNKNAEYSIK